MTDAEWVLAIGSIALVGATLGLVYATLRLSSFTKALSSATQEVARIDERRTRMEQRRARLEMARRRIALGEELIRMHRTDWLVPLQGGSFPEAEARVIRELAILVEYEKSQVSKTEMDGILHVLDISNLGTALDALPAQNFLDNFRRVQEQIAGDLQRWRQEVVNLFVEDRRET